MNTTPVLDVEAETSLRNEFSDAHARQLGEAHTRVVEVDELPTTRVEATTTRTERDGQGVYGVSVEIEIAVPIGTPTEGVVTPPPRKAEMYGSNFERFKREIERILRSTTSFGGRLTFRLRETDSNSAIYSALTTIRHET